MSARTKKIKPWIFWLSGIGVILGLALAGILFIHPRYPSRIGIAIVSNPTIVFSYDPARSILLALRVPSDVFLDVTRGYGMYPVSSLWKLDAMDNRDGMVYRETLEEAFGIPIRFYIRPLHEDIGFETPIREQMSDVFSLSSCLHAFFSHRTNMPLWFLLEMSQTVPNLRPTETVFFDLTHEAVFTNTIFPDGTSHKIIDSGRLSLLLGTHAEDAHIRKENLRIAVYNTTQSPGLAQKVARILEQAGFHVVTIANRDANHPAQCVIQGSQEVLKTHSVQTLHWLYGCLIEEQQDDSISDVTFLIGSDFEKRFLPL